MENRMESVALWWSTGIIIGEETSFYEVHEGDPFFGNTRLILETLPFHLGLP